MNATSSHSSCHRYPVLWWTLLSLNQSVVAVGGATNSVNVRQSEAVTVSLFFPPSHPTLLTPPPLPKGNLFSPQFRLHQETKITARSNWTINIYNLTEKIGDCEQSKCFLEFFFWNYAWKFWVWLIDKCGFYTSLYRTSPTELKGLEFPAGWGVFVRSKNLKK